MSTVRHDYDYAVVRLVPCVPTEKFVNIGVVLHARTAHFLDIRLQTHREWLERECPHLDIDLTLRFIEAFASVAHGGAGAGPIGLLPPSERFHWLTAPRSATIQTSPVHTGTTNNPQQTLDRLFEQVIR